MGRGAVAPPPRSPHLDAPRRLRSARGRTRSGPAEHRCADARRGGDGARFYERVRAALDGLPWELVVVDDGSTDATPQILAEIAADDERVRVISLSRNFGHQTAITAGLDHARATRW